MIATCPWIIDHYDDESDETYKNLVIKLTPEQKEIWEKFKLKVLNLLRNRWKDYFQRKKDKRKGELKWIGFI